ncbi:MAG: hypothetical protein IKC69_00720 [Clostridia bacterium]|nr:hypothetical protein [Clostridia bacterium]
MKKLLALLLALVMVFSFVACADDGWVEADDDDDEESETTSEKKKKPTETVEIKTVEQVETSGQNNNENNNQNNENNDQGGTGTVITPGGSSPVVRPYPGGTATASSVVGEWNATVSYAELYQSMFQSNPLHPYMNYQLFTLDDSFTIIFNQSGTLSIAINHTKLESEVNKLVDHLLDAVGEYLEDNNKTFQDAYGMDREAYKAQQVQTMMTSLSSLSATSGGNWTLSGNTLKITDNSQTADWGVEFDGSDKMVLIVDGFRLFYCEK